MIEGRPVVLQALYPRFCAHCLKLRLTVLFYKNVNTRVSKIDAEY